MIELDLKRRRLVWPGASCGGLPSSMAERPSRIWFHVACLQGSREWARVKAARVEPSRVEPCG